MLCAVADVDKLPPKSAFPANVSVEAPLRLMERFVGSILPLAVKVRFAFLVVNV